MTTFAELRGQVVAFLSTRQAVPAGFEGQRFSQFNRDQVGRASELAASFAEIAREAGGGEAGIAAVLDAATSGVEAELPGLVKYALLIFLTHDPTGARLGVPPLEQRHPRAVRSMSNARAAGAAAVRAAGHPADLFFFREDVLANEHHEHWHLVYRSQAAAEKDRQGELFIYMHQQMLARYDTERLAVGLPQVKALDPTEPIADGYDPYLGEAWGPRQPGQELPAEVGAHYASVASAYRDGIDTGRFDTEAVSGRYPVAATGPQPGLDLLGATVEAHAGRLQGLDDIRFGIHNEGHGEIAALSDGAEGVMASTATAIRDPVFWEWHRHIDDFGSRWQDKQGPRDFSKSPDTSPPVRIRKSLNGVPESPDIVLARAGTIGLSDLKDLAAGAAFGAEHFGGAQWDTDFANMAPATAELQTTMSDRTIRWRDGTSTDIHHLELADEFAYFIRLENAAAEPTEVTVRVFLCAQQVADDRRMWIELDKFLHTLAPSAKEVLYRPSSLSSVIRKPAGKPTGPAPPQDHEDSADYCQCGWPYNLVLPRGTREGMPFVLMVMVTDAGYDRVEDDHACGSMSFCGVRDRYPDRRNMGYPFDRPFGDGAVLNALNRVPNAAMRTVTIRWV